MPVVSISLRVHEVSWEVYEPFVIHCGVGPRPMLGDLSSAGRVVAGGAPGRLVGKTSWPSPQTFHLPRKPDISSMLLGAHPISDGQKD